MNEPDKFISESVNNTLLWSKIPSLDSLDHKKFEEDHGFNPMWPTLTYDNLTIGAPGENTEGSWKT